MSDLFSSRWPLIGMIHLEPTPGAPRHASMAAVLDAALADAAALVEGGMDGAIVENFGDAPFWGDRVPPETVAAMTAAAAEVRRRWPDWPLGINVLRNDAASAVAIAAAVGARFVRVNVHIGARWTDQGLLQGRAAETLRLRRALDADVAVWADVAVKHGRPVAAEDLAQEARELVGRGLADALIVSGVGTGAATDPADPGRIRAADVGVPTYIGSGTTAATLASLRAVADGAIVGTALKVDGVPTGRVERARVAALVAARDQLAQQEQD